MSSKRKTDLGTAAAVVAASFFFSSWTIFRLNWSSEWSPAYADVQEYFVPLWQFFRSSLLAGHLPVWNDSQELGFYFLGNPQFSLFYLPNYLLLLPEPLCFKLILVFPYMLHALGAYLLLRGWRRSPCLSALISVTITFPGFIISLYSTATVMHTLCWIPWIVWSIERLGTSSRGMAANRWGLFHGTLLAQSFLAGAWDIWIFLIPAAYLLRFSNARTLLAGVRSRSNALLMAGAWAFCLVLPQVIQTKLYLPLTIRESGMPAAEVFGWSAGLQHVFGLLSPNAMESSVANCGWLQMFGQRKGWLLSSHVSFLFLLCLPFIIRIGWRKHRFLILYVVAMVPLAFIGNLDAAVRIVDLYHIPIPIRYPDKLLIPVLYFLLLMVAKHGIAWIRLVGMRPRTFDRVQSSMVIWVAFFCVLFLIARERWLDMQVFTYSVDVSIPVKFREMYEYFTTRDMQVAVAFSLGFLVFWRVFRRRRLALSVGFWLFFAADVFLAGTKWHTIAPYYPSQESVRIPEEFSSISSGRFSVLQYRSAFALRKFKEKTGDLPFMDAKTAGRQPPWWILRTYPNAFLSAGLIQLDGANVLPIWRSRIFAQVLEVHPFAVKREAYWRTGTNLLVGPKEQMAFFHGLVDTCGPEVNGVAACILNQKAGLARFSQRAIVSINDSASIRSMLERGQHDAVYFSDSTIKPLALKVIRVRQGSVGAPPVIQSLSWKGAEKRVVLSSRSPGWLVVAQSFHPWWKAFADGKEINVQRLDYAFTGVFLPAGAREVVFTFSPRYFLVTCLFSLVGLVSLLAMCIRGSRGSFTQTSSRSVAPIPASEPWQAGKGSR